MRSEKEMLSLLVKVAQTDGRIRAAYLEGSRANPNVPRDIFQDYDVVYIVEDTTPYRQDKSWIDRFGNRLYMQYPEEGDDLSDVENCYGWLMQFADGNRLDLHVCTPSYVLGHLELYRALVDKDGILPKPCETSDEIYWVKKPTQAEFLCTCNEFWWCLNNVAKGLWRKEIPYVMDMLNFQIRPMLRRLLDWKIGMEHDFSVSTGKSSKYMNRYLPGEICEKYLQTYSTAQTDAIWDAVFTACALCQDVAQQVSHVLAFSYDKKEAQNSYRYLEHIRHLPPDAQEIYEESF